MRALFALLAVALLAGCSQPDPQPSPVDGVKDGWNQAQGAVWIVSTTGCGFCIGDPGIPELEGVLYTRAGEAMLFEYNRGGGPGVTAEPGAQAFVPFFEDLVANTDLYGIQGGRLHLHAAVTGTLSADEKRDTNAVFSAALRDATDPVPTSAQCEDCAATIVQAFGSPREQRIEDRHDNQVGDGWRRVQAQMEAIGEWLGS